MHKKKEVKKRVGIQVSSPKKVLNVLTYLSCILSSLSHRYLKINLVYVSLEFKYEL